ncbi:DNA-binding transcriptional LysR family regulator [Variovorax boronicumulans]|uniref:LysR family transcriptional regulator n=1 Tax=Variovorax boronicumulans TaxID=436515 RepID=UPI00277D6209|nr:LysR family transcriptional regulator [Variovorax boronicumulans]MDP9996488.1 DNA-binding transcriptional LysR family regulator [Variovorax boronicumulans]MDQ0007800.1 DNA-binding transcriptional LysR family regulator [Variovorax boronicumulans]
MRIQYSVDDLRGFCSLVRLGQYTDAAEQLSITPSALSRRIQNLERAIGGKVFDRTTRKVLLTPAGVALYERVVPLLSELDSGLTEAARVARGEEGALVIATVATVAHSKLPQVLPDFSKRYPKAFLSIRDGIAASITTLVEERVAEFGISTHMSFGPALEAKAIAPYGFNLIAGAAHPALKRRKSIAWTDLPALRVVSLNRLSSTRLQVDDELAGRSLPTPWYMEVDQLSTLLGLVQNWGFTAVLPSTFDAHAIGLRSVPIVAPEIQRELFLVKRRDASLSPHGAYLADLLTLALRQ